MKMVFDFPREVMELSTEKGKGFRIAQPNSRTTVESI